MKSAIIAFSLVLFCTTANGVEVNKRGGKLSSDDPTASELLSQADDIFQTRDYDSALGKYLEVVEAARKEFNRSVEVEALSQVARMNLILGDRETGEEYLAQAEGRASENDPMGWSRYLGVKGRFEWKAGDLQEARKTFEQMFEYCDSNALAGRAVDAAHMIAIVAESPDDQVEWGRRGIEMADAHSEERWLGPLWNNLAGTYYDMRQFDSALVCYINAREYHWRFSGETAKLLADYHIGMTYRLLGEYEEAGRWLRPVLAWAERIEDYSAIGQACEDLGETEIGLGRKAAGLALLRRAREAYKKEGYDHSWPEIWEHINKRIAELE